MGAKSEWPIRLNRIAIKVIARIPNTAASDLIIRILYRGLFKKSWGVKITLPDHLSLVGEGNEDACRCCASQRLLSSKAALAHVIDNTLDGSHEQAVEVAPVVVERGNGRSTSSIVRHSVFSRPSGDKLLQLIEKIIAPPEGTPSHSAWAAEAVAYADPDLLQGNVGVRAPRCLGIHSTPGGPVHVFLEDLQGLKHPRNQKQRVRAARALGRFNGWATAQRMWDKPWMPEAQLGRRQDFARMRQVRQGLHDLGIAAPAAERIYDGFCRVVAALPVARTLYESSQRTVAHMDAHPANILITPNAKTVYALDWAMIAKGRLGDDVAKPLAAWPLLLGKGCSLDEYRQLENDIFEAYVHGICDERETSADEVRGVYMLRAFFNCLVWFRKGPKPGAKFMALDPVTQQGRIQTLADWLMLQNECVLNLLRCVGKPVPPQRSVSLSSMRRLRW